MTAPSKLLLLIFDERDRDIVEEVLTHERVGGFTEIPGTLGEGVHGKRLASALYPGANVVILTVVPESRVSSVRDALLRVAGEGASGRGERAPIRIAVVAVEAFH
jgi:hypothetical protein